MAEVPLTTEQRKELIRILAVYGNVNRDLERKYFLDTIGLSEIISIIPIAEPNTRIFCNELIDALQRRGTLPQTRQPALILMLRYLREEVVDGHQKERDFLDRLLTPYLLDTEATDVKPIIEVGTPATPPQPDIVAKTSPEVVTSLPKIVAPQKITPEQQRLLDIMQDMRYPIEERAKAGMELAAIGDPRPGVGLRGDGVPDIVWCKVPGTDEGRPPVLVGGNGGIPLWVRLFEKMYGGVALPAQTMALSTFAISKYPITYRQFQAFVDDKGFKNDQWWEQGDKRILHSQEYRYWNHPRENIDWYTAMAFCKWLSAKLGQTVRLPTEEEWEKAARGEEGRFFPWGNNYISGYANNNETDGKVGVHYLAQTSAVGIYPQGSASPYGVMDMAGNVWEWTSSAWEQKDKEAEQKAGQILYNNVFRVLRGGSFVKGAQFVRCAYRNSSNPQYELSVYGFRVVLS